MITFDLQKNLGDFELNVRFELGEGDFLTLHGPSGAGKTSILRMMAGLLKPGHGFIEVGNECWYDSAKSIWKKPQERSVGMVFQDYALFPTMTVRENLAFALPKKGDHRILDELTEIMELGGLEHRKPSQLSGGQQQRVALARALAKKPQLLLLDEPLAALDQGMRLRVQDYLLDVHRRYGLTTLLVSHDMGEVFRLSNRVLTLEKGRILRQGSPSEVFTHKNLSGKFQFTGHVVHLKQEDTIQIVSVLIDNHVIKVVATPEEVRGFAVGDKVIVASKAFNPMIRKID
ncbi:MAG: ATP-binding cassette domain-containing protein [Cyclobacteriaceae bacterium]|nr:ATP-binding cassette domain-containing protein [Cyclobacteriaceae bacterium]